MFRPALSYLHIRENSSIIKRINILLYLSACSFKFGTLCPLDFQSHLKACLCCSAAGSGWWSFKCQLKSTHTLIEPIPQLCVWNHICKWQRKQSYYDLLSLFNSCVLQCDGKKWGSLRCKLQLFDWSEWFSSAAHLRKTDDNAVGVIYCDFTKMNLSSAFSSCKCGCTGKPLLSLGRTIFTALQRKIIHNRVIRVFIAECKLALYYQHDCKNYLLWVWHYS